MGIARSLGLIQITGGMPVLLFHFEYCYQKMGVLGKFAPHLQQFDKKNVIFFHIS
jgi:hypothetical protein